MRTLIYNHEKQYIPKTKYELAEILARNYCNNELQKPENQDKTRNSVYWELYNRFMRETKKNLYAIYFQHNHKPKKIKLSKLEKKTHELQQRLF